MACINVTLIKDQMVDDVPSGTSTATQEYYVEWEPGVVDSADVLASSFGGVTIPGVYGSYSANRPNCKVKTRTADRITGMQFKVTITFADPTLGQFPPDLLAQPAKIDEDDQTWMCVECRSTDIIGVRLRHTILQTFHVPSAQESRPGGSARTKKGLIAGIAIRPAATDERLRGRCRAGSGRASR